MPARVLIRQVAALRLCAPPSSRAVCKARSLCSRREDGEQEKEEETRTVHQPANALVYNPSAYYQKNIQQPANLAGPEMEEEEEEASRPVLNTTFRLQSNPYTVNSSRHISSAKNALLSLAFSRQGTRKGGTSLHFHPQNTQPDVKGDTRAFQRCRPEYLNMTHDIFQHPPAVHFKEASLVLHKVTLMKGNMEPSDITNFLCKLSQLSPEQTRVIRGDTRFYMLLRYSVENLQHFTNPELMEVLRTFVRLGLSPSHSILGLYETEFSRRAEKLEFHQLLLVADLWRCLGRSVPHYLERMCDLISQHFGQMGPPELVQFLYVLGEGRRCPAHLLQPLENILMRHLDKLKAEEVGAICLGLFKSQSSFSEEAVRKLVDRACALLEQMSEFAVVNVLKLMRFSHLDHRPWLEAMGLEVPRRAPQMGVQGLMHVALACSALHYRDERILLAVAEHLPQVASHCRSKDAAKLLWAFGTLGVLPNRCPRFYPCLVEILRERVDEFQRFPEHLLTALLGLAFVGQFPHDLLSVALSPEFINRASRFQELELKKDLFTLDGTVTTELPGWTGPRLSLAVREDISKQLWDFAQSDVCQKLEVIEAESVLQELLGGDAFVHKRMILPHMRSIDLEVHLDANEQPLPLCSRHKVHHSPAPEEESALPGWETHSGVTLTDDLLAQLTQAKKIPEEPSPKPFQRPVLRTVEPQIERESILSVGVDLTDGLLHALTKPGTCSPSFNSVVSRPKVIRLAIQVTNRNHYCYRTQQLLGLHAMKRRQLALLGYRVVELPHWEWFPLLRRSRTEKLAYVHCKIFSSNDSAKRT
ncbi:FAST kinase domain-containing protein 5, mitochondrial [Hoplias malabaricus]|uniref:FAST kinase domain-containing protein 5, mitochondrial n=1 Tax=Hoplias malabaricus TaxID=27720 RepID=UPI0034633894